MEKLSKTKRIKRQLTEKTADLLFHTKESAVPNIPQPRQQNITQIFIPSAFVLLVVIAGLAIYYYRQYQGALQNTSSDSQNEMRSLVGTIGTFLELPADEEPTLATVTDVEKIKVQPFFAKAQNGDKVLFYTNAAQAILFRPATGKVVNMTTVSVTGNENITETSSPTPPAVSETETTNVSVALYNGSTKIGVTNTLEEEIKSNFENIAVVMKEKAVKNDYQGNLVIDLSGKNGDLVNKIAERVNGTVGELPLGETAPLADILVIVGNQ